MTHWTVIPAISAIQEAVCDHTGVTVAELVSGRRDRRVVVPRMTAMWLARWANYTFPVIGDAFGGRHHTTVLSAVRRIEKMMDEEPEFAELVDTLIHAIGRVAVPRRVANA
jgi:chromosomal replication initiator protein